MAEINVQLHGISGEELNPKTTASQVIIEKDNGEIENVEESVERILSKLKCFGGPGILSK